MKGFMRQISIYEILQDTIEMVEWVRPLGRKYHGDKKG